MRWPVRRKVKSLRVGEVGVLVMMFLEALFGMLVFQKGGWDGDRVLTRHRPEDLVSSPANR